MSWFTDDHIRSTDPRDEEPEPEFGTIEWAASIAYTRQEPAMIDPASPEWIEAYQQADPTARETRFLTTIAELEAELEEEEAEVSTIQMLLNASIAENEVLALRHQILTILERDPEMAERVAMAALQAAREASDELPRKTTGEPEG